jgi:hypothetical protein
MATITFSATANTSNSAQVGTLTVAGITYTVTQSAAAGPPAAFFTGEDSLSNGGYYLQFPVDLLLPEHGQSGTLLPGSTLFPESEYGKDHHDVAAIGLTCVNSDRVNGMPSL